MLSEILTFIFFVLIGLEIREGLQRPKDAILPAISALGGMLLPALIFTLLVPGSRAWAVSMPTDVALAIGALSILGKRVNPAVRLFLLTLAVADDFFSLVVIGIFFNDDLHLASAIYTLGAAAIGGVTTSSAAAAFFAVFFAAGALGAAAIGSVSTDSAGFAAFFAVFFVAGAAGALLAAGNVSRSLRATGASIDDDAPLTNSPNSASFETTSFESTPSSFASS